MFQFKEINEMYDEYIDLFYTKPKKKPKIRFKLLHKIDAYFDKKDEEREIKRLEKNGTGGKLEALDELTHILKELERYDLGYFPFLHKQEIFLSEVELDLGPFVKDKKVTSKLYYTYTTFLGGQFTCYDEPGHPIAETSLGRCGVLKKYAVDYENDFEYNLKSEQIIKKQIADGISQILDMFLETGKKNLEELKKMHNIQEPVKEAVAA